MPRHWRAGLSEYHERVLMEAVDTAQGRSAVCYERLYSAVSAGVVHQSVSPRCWRRGPRFTASTRNSSASHGIKFPALDICSQRIARA